MLNALLVSMAQAQQAAGAAAGAAPSPFSGLIPLLFIFVVFYFLLIRPQQKKYKEHQSMIAAVQRGDKVVTGGGIHGKVSKVEDTTVIVQIAEGVEITVDKGSLGNVLTKTGEPKKAAGSKPSNDN